MRETNNHLKPSAKETARPQAIGAKTKIAKPSRSFVMNQWVKRSIVRIVLAGELDVTSLTQVAGLCGIKGCSTADANRKVIEVLREFWREIDNAMNGRTPPTGGAPSMSQWRFA